MVYISHFLFIVYRYLKGKNGKLFSVNARLSFFGVFSGTTLLVMVLSVFNGFQNQVKNSIFQFDPHIIIEDSTGPGEISNWLSWENKIHELLGENVSSVRGMIQSPAIMRRDKNIDHVFIRSMEFQKKGDKLYIPDEIQMDKETGSDRLMARGSYCLIGREMGYLYDLSIGDSLDLIVPKGQFSARVGIEPKMKSYIVAGFFSTGHYQYDSRVVILPLEQAQKLFSIGDKVQQIAVKLKSLDSLFFMKKILLDELPYYFNVRTIEEEQRNFFSALKLEKTIMVTIVFLFIIAAMIGIVVATFNIVRSRKKDIGIFKALGMSDNEVLMIFTMTGFAGGLLGTVTGILFGIYLSLNLENILNFIELLINKTGWIYSSIFSDGLWVNITLIPKDIYYFEHLPVNIDIAFLHTLAIVAILLSGLASLIPAWYAGRLQPIEIIQGADK